MTATTRNARHPPRLKRLSLSRQGRFIPLGHGRTPPAAPAGFSPCRYTEAQQRDNPHLPMTRLIKDVLHVGRWKTGVDPRSGRPVLWNVTEETLYELAGNLALAQSRGVAMNLTNGHGDRQSGLVDFRDLIAPIDEAVVENGVLWVSAYVTPQQARRLQNPAMKVSPGVYDDWLDGFGNRYSSQLIHVAVTDHPVVAGQGQFLAMCNIASRASRSKSGYRYKGRLRTLANETLEGAISFDRLVSQIDRILALADLGVDALPETIKAETFHEVLDSILYALEAQHGTEESDVGYGTTEELAEIPVLNAMANRLRRGSLVRTLSNRQRTGPEQAFKALQRKDLTPQEREAAQRAFWGLKPKADQ